MKTKLIQTVRKQQHKIRYCNWQNEQVFKSQQL